MKIIPLLAALAMTSISPALLCHAQDAGKSEAAGANVKTVAPLAASQTFDLMMDALKDDDYNAFISMGDSNFQHALSKTLFEEVDAQVGPRAKEGFKATYLDSLKRGPFAVYLWKIEFRNGDDALVQMSFHNGKVGGFLLS